MEVTQLAIPSVSDLKSKADRALGYRDAMRNQLGQVQVEVKELSDETRILGLVSGLFRKLIESETEAGVKKVEEMLTKGLNSIFPDKNLGVRASLEHKRGKVYVKIMTQQTRPDGVVVDGECQKAFGGAVTTAESALLRIVVMKRRGLRPLILLDESLGAFDSNYVHNIGKYLKLVCQEMGVDMLLVSHNQAIIDAANKGYHITLDKKTNAANFEEVVT